MPKYDVHDDRTDTQTDASAGWRREYRHQHADPELRTDGGRAPVEAFGDGGTTKCDLPDVGERVRDRDTDRDELLVVETHPDTRAIEYEIGAIDASVAAVNSAYDPSSPVVEAVYAEEAADALDGWRSVEDLRDAVSFGAIRAYTFPADRLAPVEEGRP